MRDLNLLSETLRAVWTDGDGRADCLPAFPKGVAWFAGGHRLNGPAVSDLLADGWLRQPPNAAHADASGCPPWMTEAV